MKKTEENLITDKVNPSPDYYCTWQTQLYATADGKPARQRAVIGEKALFGKEKPFGWAYFYEKARKDLLLVMDDSWDVPPNDDGKYYGSLHLDGEKFPDAVLNAETNYEALNNLCNRIKSLGWKGLGGWVCAQESKQIDKDLSENEYWQKRLTEADKSGFSYWKVDWGNKATDYKFRKMLTETAHSYAPNLIIEHAIIPKILPYCDVYRTYDVPAVTSIPMTMQKLADIFNGNSTEKLGLINCEDEAYIAAAGGFTMGIMRHPYSGPFMNGKADMSFPEIGRNLKTKTCEVTRAVRWHRMAPAFKMSPASVRISENILQDNWRFVLKEQEIESWWLDNELFSKDLFGDTVKKSAPQQLAVNCGFAKSSSDENGNIPYIVSSKNPNGVFSVATLGRTVGREYFVPKCDITIDIGNSSLLGIFGEYKTLYVKTGIKHIKEILMQDIADDFAYDITSEVKFFDDGFLISGEIIHKIGTLAQGEDDTSEPAVAVKLHF